MNTPKNFLLKWNNCNKKLPPLNIGVLGMFDDGSIMIVEYEDGFWTERGEWEYNMEDIKFWALLPEVT